MPTAPGGARWVGVALWKPPPTVPWGAGWEAEKGAIDKRATSFASSSELVAPPLSSLSLKNNKLTDRPWLPPQPCIPRRAP